MVRTPLCDLLGIEVPIICAPFGPWDQVDLAAAVCNAGALGSLGTALRGVDELRRHAAADRLRDEVRTAAAEDRLEELLPFSGQSAALIHDVIPAGQLIARIMADAEDALAAATSWIARPTA